MKHKKYFTTILLTAFMCFAAFAQIPTVTLTASKTSLNEGESTLITATLSTVSTQDVTIDFDLSGTAKDGINYYSESKMVKTVVGTGSLGSGANQLNAPYGIAFDTAGDMYIAESNNHRIQKFTKTGNGSFNPSGITVAGTGIAGSGSTQLNIPKGIAFDAKGNLYVADYNNSRVQKFKTTGTGTFNPTGVTVAGTGGVGGFDDQLKNPEAIAFDAVGYLYVADYNNSRIQQFPTATQGIGIGGTLGKTITQIAHPRGVAFDSTGDMYVVDTYYDYIIKYAKTGTGTFSSTRITVAGTGAKGLGSTPLNNPYGIAYDASGNMYISTKMSIQKFENIGNGNFSNIGATVAGAATLGSGATQLNTPCGLTFDSSGNMYVADNKNHRIQQYIQGKLQITIPAGSTTGSLTINALTATSTPKLFETIILTATATNATITDVNPMTITINLLPKVVVTASKPAIAEGENTLIIATLSTASTKDVTVNFALSGTAKTADYTVMPANIIIPAGSTTGSLTVNTLTDLLDKEIGETVIFTATVTNSTIIGTNQTTITINNVPTVKVTTSKSVLKEGENTTVTATLSAACTEDVAVIFDLAGTATEDFDYYSKNKQVLTVAGTGTSGSGANRLYVPKNVAFDTAGNMYVADTYNHRIQKFEKTGAVTFNPEGTSVAGTGTPGTGSTKLSFPEEVAFDSAGNMYVADSNGARIQKFTKTGSGTFDTTGITVAGTGLAGSGSTRLNVPRGLAFDTADNLYVVDSANHRIQKFANTGTGTFNPSGITVAGTGAYGSGSAQLDTPQNMTFDSSGNMYVADYFNDRIQKFISTGSGTFNTSGINVAWAANPRGVAFDAKGNMYVAEQSDNLIVKFTKTGTGTFTSSGTIMAGTVALGSLSSPEGVAFDAAGNMYVVDSSNHRIQQYLSSGKLQITIPAGSTSANLTVNALTDTLNPEPDETVILTATAINATIAGINATTLTISNLPPTVAITVDKTNVYEGEETTVTATLSAISSSDVTVELTLSGTTTVDDYSISTTKITIPAGHTTGTATIKTVMDSDTEENETLIVTTASAEGATVVGLEITISIQDVINLGLESHQLLDAKIYPNPVMDLLRIDIPENYLFKSVEIFNLLGQLQGEFTQETISIGNLPTGDYILKIHTAKGVIVKKIIKK